MFSLASLREMRYEFWIYLVGETISNLGSSVTIFALPLLIFRLTGSALYLSIATVVNFLPYLLFGLTIGAWVDRLNRKHLMIVVDLLNALAIATIPILSLLHSLPIWWIYVIGFLNSTLSICFDAAEFAAVPNLVAKKQLVTANGYLQASYSAAAVIGPILAGALVAIMPISSLLFLDASSFIVSALTLLLIHVEFNTEAKKRRGQSIYQEIREGFLYVWQHPVLRNISLMLLCVNLVSSTRLSQLVFLAKNHLNATDTQVGWLYAASSVGVVLLSLLAGSLRSHFRFSTVALGALVFSGLCTIVMALAPWYWLVLMMWALIAGLAVLFNINTVSLRQEIVPTQLLGRVGTTSRVLAWSANPLGAFMGGFLILWTQNVSLVYMLIGLCIVLIASLFSFTAIGHAERYLPVPEGPDMPDTVSTEGKG